MSECANESPVKRELDIRLRFISGLTLPRVSGRGCVGGAVIRQREKWSAAAVAGLRRQITIKD